MKCIIYGLYNAHHMPIIERASDIAPLEYCHIIGNAESNRLRVSFIKNSTFDNWHEISESYKDLNWDKITPLDANLIESMRLCEIEILKMMDRKTSNTYNAWSYEKRKRVYLEHLRYWNHVLEATDFDFFWGLNIPHEVIDYIISSLCQKRNIPCLYFYQWNPDLTYLIDNWKDPFPALKNIPSAKEVKQIPLKELQKDFEIRTTVKNQPLPFYLEQNANSNILYLASKLTSSVLKKAKYLLFSPKDFIKEFALNRKTRNIRNFYNKRVYHPQKNDKYFYCPLHLQPELSTSPLAGAFVDQTLIVQMISHHLPEDTLIYVKEHPVQNLNQRSLEFYSKLYNIPKVRFISPRVSSTTLIRDCAGVVTATGTTGWEALFLAKNVIIFGNTFFQYCPGVFRVKTNSECKRAIELTISENHQPTTDDVWDFLYALSPYAIEGNIDVFYGQASKLSYENDINNLATAFANRVADLFKTNK